MNGINQPTESQPTPAAVLGYRGEDFGQIRTPGVVTAMAVLGIVLSGVLLIAQGLIPWRDVSQEVRRSTTTTTRYTPYSYSDDMSQPPTMGQFLVSGGVLGFSGMCVTMIVGCAGVLCRRSAGRTTMLVSAWAWVIFGLIESVLLAIGISASSMPVRGWIAVLLVILTIVGVQVVYPLMTISFLRRPAAVRALSRHREMSQTTMPAWGIVPDHIPLTGAAKVGTILLVIAGGLSVIWTLATLTASLGRGLGRFYSNQWMLPASEPGERWAVTTAALIGLLLTITLIVGCIVLLRGGTSVGSRLIVIYAIGQMAMMAAGWSYWLRPDRISSGSASATMTMWIGMLASRVMSLLLPGLLVAFYGLMGDRVQSAPQMAMPPQAVRGGPEYTLD